MSLRAFHPRDRREPTRLVDSSSPSRARLAPESPRPTASSVEVMAVGEPGPVISCGAASTGLFSQKGTDFKAFFFKCYILERLTIFLNAPILMSYMCPESLFGACLWWAHPTGLTWAPACRTLFRPRQLLTPPLGISLALPIAGLSTSCPWPPACL